MTREQSDQLYEAVIDRLDRVLVTDANGDRFVLSRKSAANLYNTVLEVFRASGIRLRSTAS